MGRRARGGGFRTLGGEQKRLCPAWRVIMRGPRSAGVSLSAIANATCWHLRTWTRSNAARRLGIKRGRMPGEHGGEGSPRAGIRRRNKHLACLLLGSIGRSELMDRPDRQQHQFFMPLPMQQPHPPPPQQLCVPMVDEQASFLAAGRGGGGGGGGGGAAAGRSGERKRRFTDEQIRSLESMFHAHHAKLEPREKAELARELGLQPRQVAIWFQNKRARWRSKQLEHDYAALRAKFDALRDRVESLKHEKLALTTQLQELSERLREREERAGSGGAATASSSSCNGGGEEAEDDKRNVVLGCVGDMEPPESCVLGGACATPADVSVESECGGDHQHHLDYDDGFFPDNFCATPELWEPWPLVEWNAVA